MMTRHCCLLTIIVMILGSIAAPTSAERLFDTRMDFKVNYSPSSLAIGDMNNDSIPDLVIAIFWGSDIQVFLGNGDGTYQWGIEYNFSSGVRPTALVINDLDGDGNLDLATVNYGTVNMAVLLGNGDGSFNDAVFYPVGVNPRSINSSDLNGDGLPDIAVMNYTSQEISIHLGLGDGSFQPAVFHSLGVGSYKFDIGDLNGDDIQDLAVPSRETDSIVFLIGNGDGTFQAGVHTATGDAPVAVAVADLDDNGMADMVTVNVDSEDVSVLMGNGDGTFEPPLSFGVCAKPNSVAINDLNGDGNLDLAVSNGGWTNTYFVSVFLGNGDGTFQAGLNFASAPESASIDIDDLNGDGIFDLAVINPGLCTASVFIGKGDGTFPATVHYPAGDTPISAAIEDLDGDGINDVAVSDYAYHQVFIGLGNGDGTLRYGGVYNAGAEGTFVRSVSAGDLNGDSVPDLVLANYYSSVSVLLGNGDGSFGPYTNYYVGWDIRDVALADLDNDGDLDLVTAHYQDFHTYVLKGNGDGTFGMRIGHPLDCRAYSVEIGDLNNDNRPDLVVSAWEDGVRVLLGTGYGSFMSPIPYEVGDEAVSTAIGDLDGDGNPDLAVADLHSQGSSKILVFPGNGDGTFNEPSEYDAGYSYPTCSIDMDDMNGDGNLDVIITNSESYNVAVFLGAGDGTLRAGTGYGVGDGPRFAVVGDLDGNGSPDLAVTNIMGDSLSVLLNSGYDAQNTVSADLTCIPSSGTLPFATQLKVTLRNPYTEQYRRIAARLNVSMAAGPTITNWRRGYTDIAPWSNLVVPWSQTIPAIGSLVGANTFTLEADDVTPVPYNQPPYPPAGDTDFDSCTVTGVAP